MKRVTKRDKRENERNEQGNRKGWGENEKFLPFPQRTLHDILVASSWRVSILISEILNAPISPRKRHTHTIFLSFTFFFFISFIHDVPGCVRVCLRLRQSQRSIVHRCIILLGAKGDDFITDPGNHSPKLTLFSVSTVLLVLPRVVRAQFYLSRFHEEKREKRRENRWCNVNTHFAYLRFLVYNELSKKRMIESSFNF